MKKISVVFASFALAAVVAAPAAHGQATRTWVSGVGDDANPCSRTAPCKTYAGAISKTAAGGEISTLDPGGFGGVTITKAITINGDGTLAGILVAGAGVSGVIVNAGVNDRVVLRNLSIQGTGTASNGIRFIAGKSLVVDNVTISGLINRGIDMSHGTNGDLMVKNTTITNVPTGVFVNSTGGTANASLEHVHLFGLTNGVEVSNARATVSNSVISSNVSNGVLASHANSRVNVDNSQLSFNGLAALNASVAFATIRMSNNDIFQNNTSLTIAASGVISSAGNNRVAGNGAGSVNPNGTAITSQ